MRRKLTARRPRWRAWLRDEHCSPRSSADLISERTREGLARARASGRTLGRPKGSLGVSKTAIAKITGVSRTSLYSFMRTRGLKPSP